MYIKKNGKFGQVQYVIMLSEHLEILEMIGKFSHKRTGQGLVLFVSNYAQLRYNLHFDCRLQGPVLFMSNFVQLRL